MPLQPQPAFGFVRASKPSRNDDLTPARVGCERNELKKEFDAKACVEILDPLKFIQRWLRALPAEALVTSGAVGDYQKYVCRMVKYDHGHDLPGNVWAIPDLITTTKLKKADAFKFENVRLSWLIARRGQP